MSRPSARTVVAIPARDEAAHIGVCLQALIVDAVRPPDDILVLVNNSSDATADLARAWQGRASTGVHVVERHLEGRDATAGHARRVAVQVACRMAGSEGVVVSTDADARADPDFLSAACRILAGGIDLVAGWVELEPADWAAIPIVLHEDDAREVEYDTLCDRIHHLLDPDPADPLPRHTQTPGACLIATAAALHACGGVPDVPRGEDRALVAAMRRIDARIRHAPEVHAHVSGRTVGRAAGGMAETIARRMVAPDPELDDRLEPADTVARRASARRRAREIFHCADRKHSNAVSELAEALRLDAAPVLRALDTAHFGEAWHRLATLSPTLAPVRVPVSALGGEVARARAILDRLEAGTSRDVALPAS